MVATMAATETKMSEMSEWFEKSQLYRDLKEKERATILEQRQATAEKLREVNEAEAKAVPPLTKKLELAEQRVRDAQVALEKARSALGDAFEAEHSAVNRFELHRRRHKRFLEESAPPEIDEFLTKLTTWLHGDGDGHSLHRELHQANYKKDEGRLRVTMSNWPTVKRWATAVQKAIEEARTLKLEALTPKELAKRIVEIQGQIPDPAKVRSTFEKV